MRDKELFLIPIIIPLKRLIFIFQGQITLIFIDLCFELGRVAGIMEINLWKLSEGVRDRA